MVIPLGIVYIVFMHVSNGRLPLWWYHPESDSFMASETDPSNGINEMNEIGRFATEEEALAACLAEIQNDEAMRSDPELSVKCATFRPDIISDYTRNKMAQDRKSAEESQ